VDEVGEGRKKITLGTVVRYVFGVIFLLFGISEIIIANYLSGLFFILAAIVTIKPTMNYLEQKLNFSFSNAASFFVVFCLVIVAFAAVPNDTQTADKSDELIAESPDSGQTQTTTLNNKVYSSDVINTNYECVNWSSEQYPEIWLFGDRYVPLFSINDKIWEAHVNKLAKPVLDSREKYTIRTGEMLDLGEGYTLEAKQVDVDGQKVWFEFRYNGDYVDDEIISNSDTWNIEFDDLQGEDGIVVFRIHVSQIFNGAVDSIAQVDGLWLIDYANAETLEVGDRFGNYIVKEIHNGVDDSNLGSLVFDHDNTQDSTDTALSGVATYSEPTTGVSAEYQDEEWLAACGRNAPIVADDLKGYAKAASNTDYSSLATYTDLLYQDSQTALDESDMYAVSPELQGVKDEYKIAMVQANWCAVHTAIAINDINNGNTDDAVTSMNQAADALKSCNEHTTTANRLLDEYNSNKE